jgi:predicted PurR-regulated permease PerM
MSTAPDRKSPARLIFLAFGLAIAVALAWYLRHALLLIYVSAVFAIVLQPAVERVHRLSILGWTPSRGSALLLLIVALLLALGVFAAIALPPLIDNIRDFAAHLPSELEQLRSKLKSIPLLNRLDVGRLPAGIFSASPGIAAGIGGAVMDVLTALLLIAYFILDGGRLMGALLSIFPQPSRDRLDRTLTRAGRRMRGWLSGQLILMLVLAVSSGVTFGLMRLPYFLLLAVFAGIANIIPLLGPIATVVLAAISAATESGWKVLGVLIFYLVYQQVENGFLTPRIMKAQVQLSSAVVVIALLVFGELAGIAGALVAVPSAVLVVELAGEYLAKPEV